MLLDKLLTDPDIKIPQIILNKPIPNLMATILNMQFTQMSKLVSGI
jgi:hypothetical protein